MRLSIRNPKALIIAVLTTLALGACGGGDGALAETPRERKRHRATTKLRN
ncbi:hypothetical protein BH23ACT12_BH23ACT12_11160 [soil metagenome]